MSKKYSSEAMAAIHETMESLHTHGIIDKISMREFDESCLAPMDEISPKEILPYESMKMSHSQYLLFI